MPEDSVSSEETVDEKHHIHHAFMFLVYHILLDQTGYQSFATEEQLHGVVAVCTKNNFMDVCALKNCTIDHHGMPYFLERSFITSSRVNQNIL
jgi:hypothetical protein